MRGWGWWLQVQFSEIVLNQNIYALKLDYVVTIFKLSSMATEGLWISMYNEKRREKMLFFLNRA